MAGVRSRRLRLPGPGEVNVSDSDACTAISTERHAAVAVSWHHLWGRPPEPPKAVTCKDAGCWYAREGFDACAQGCINVYAGPAKVG